MAIAFDASSQSSSSGLVSSLTWSHTCTGTDRILFVLFGENTGTPSQSGVTYGGVAMTQLTGAQAFCTGWYLVNPASGANNIIATRSVPSTAPIRGVGVSYTGAKQTGQPDSQNKGTATGNVTVATTVLAANSWIVGYGSNDNDQVLSAGSGFTLRLANSGDPSMAMFDSNGTVATGSVSSTINAAGNTTGLIVASFSPSVAATSFPELRLAFL